MTKPEVFVYVFPFLPFPFARENKKWFLFLPFDQHHPLINVATSKTLKITSLLESLKCFSTLEEKHIAAVSVAWTQTAHRQNT